MLTYWDYLKLDRLLALQGGVDDEDAESADELHFIIVHQVHELWFKLVLRGLRLGRDHLAAPYMEEQTVPQVVHHLRRVNTILQSAVDHMRVVESLTPQDFLAFRDKLIPASGFQSFQMRELEIVMGLEDSQRIQYGNESPLEHIRRLGAGTSTGERAWARIENARNETSFLTALHDWLYRTPIQGSSPDDPDDDQAVIDFLDEYLAASRAAAEASHARLANALGDPEALRKRFESTFELGRNFLFASNLEGETQTRVRRVRAAALFIESYRDLPLLSWPRLLLDMVLEMEEQMVLFRHRHARMVERVIGRRVGTGGSGGVDYLDKTGSYRIFGTLWTVRTMLLAKDALPPLRHAERYGFAAEP